MGCMKALVLRDAFGLDHLSIEERPEPKPGPGQVLLRMRAASLNFRDIRMLEGLYNPRQALPLVPASDGVGEVVELGEGVERVATGERVCPMFAQGWIAGGPRRERIRRTLGGPLDGTLAEYMVVDAESVVRAPGHMSDEQAACLPCAGVTAWSALVTTGSVKPGDVVLTEGTGGVSIFALQIAKLLGARVIATSSSDTKLERAKELGASEVINYKKDREWGKTARGFTVGARGVDHVVEVGGGATLPQALKAIAPGGRISIIGVLSGVATDLSLLPILMNGIRLQGVFVGHRDAFEALAQACEVNQLDPVIEHVYPLEEARDAFEHMKSSGQFGKICVSIAE